MAKAAARARRAPVAPDFEPAERAAGEARGGSGATAKITIDWVSVEFPGRSTSGPLRALDHVSLTIGEGEFVCLLGPSGCGKTTLLNAIAGFIEPSEGDIWVDNRSIVGPGADRGVVFQEYGLFPWFTIEQNVQYGPRLRGLPNAELRRISQHYLELVHLKGFEKHYPNELSGGMRQRVGIARALANQPEILLMDEPFGALDEQTRERMQDELLKIWEGERRTCIFVTHSINEAIVLADRVVAMTARPGCIKADVRVELTRPRDRTSEEFFALYRRFKDILRDEIERASMEDLAIGSG